MTPDETTTCCGSDRAAKNVQIDFLYLDLDSCTRCGSASTELDEAVTVLQDVIDTLGFTLSVNKMEVSSLELAEEYQFVSSPTIRVNGQDICGDVVENSCKDCSDICGSDVECRVFEYGGKEYDAPPKAMIVDAVLRAIYQPATCDRGSYAIPNNLEIFFRANYDPDIKSEKCCSLRPEADEFDKQ